VRGKLSRWQCATRVEPFEFRGTATIVIRCQGLVVGPVFDRTDHCCRSTRHRCRDDHPHDHDSSTRSLVYFIAAVGMFSVSQDSVIHAISMLLLVKTHSNSSVLSTMLRTLVTNIFGMTCFLLCTFSQLFGPIFDACSTPAVGRK